MRMNVGYKALKSITVNDYGLTCEFSNAMTGESFTHAFSSNTLSIQDIVDWVSGKKLIQNAFPNLNAEEREWFLTGFRDGDFQNDRDDP